MWHGTHTGHALMSLVLLTAPGTEITLSNPGRYIPGTAITHFCICPALYGKDTFIYPRIVILHLSRASRP